MLVYIYMLCQLLCHALYIILFYRGKDLWSVEKMSKRKLEMPNVDKLDWEMISKQHVRFLDFFFFCLSLLMLFLSFLKVRTVPDLSSSHQLLNRTVP